MKKAEAALNQERCHGADALRKHLEGMKMTNPARRFLATLAAGTVLLPVLAEAQVLAPHRAVYDLSLIDSTTKSGITGVNGRMVYEFNGSACDGYTVSFRSVTQFLTGENEPRMVDQQVTTYEDPGADLFSFASKSFIDEKLDKEVKGTARHEQDKKVKVDLEKPDPASVALTPAHFPAAHMIDLLERARKGETFYETAIYDGTETADKVLTTTVVIGSLKKADIAAGDTQAAGELGKDDYWPVSIAYFDDPEPDSDAAPIYRIGFKLYDNGVARDFETDYGEFRIRGKLVTLDLLETPKCN